MKTNWFKRTLCSILAFVMVLGYVPATAFAAEEDGLCEHHPQHTESCGYSAAMEGHACNHAHTDECYQSVTKCVHTHGDCGYVQAVEGHGCDCQPNDSGEIVHAEGCGFVKAVAEVPCGHVCSVESGCIQKVMNCQHQHDSECGYAEAKLESSCTYACEECEKERASQQNKRSEEQTLVIPTILTWEDYRYTLLADGSVSICGFEGTPEKEDEAFLVEIPSEINGAKVTEIAENAFADNSDIEAILLPETIEAIGSGAFEDCEKLKVIAFCGDAPSFGESLAKDSEKLEKVLILDGSDFTELVDLLKLDLGEEKAGGIQFQSFTNIAALEEAVQAEGANSDNDYVDKQLGNEISSLNTDGNFNALTATPGKATVEARENENIVASGLCGENVQWKLDKDGLLTISGTGEMQDYDAHDAPWHDEQFEIKSVIVEKNVSNIGVAAFWDCGSITSVTISEGVNSIGEDAFRACSNLTSVTIPEGVTTIGNCAFGDCINLISVSIPESVTTIGSSVFYRCNSLTSVTIPEGITAIASETFYGCSGLTSLNIPKSVTSIGVYAFEGCSGLTSMTIPEGVAAIGVGAFRYCGGLTTVSIPKGVATLDNYTFDGCSSLVSATIPEGVTTIGGATFSNCSNLTSATIPSSVTSIGFAAFSGCTKLSDIHYSGTAENWGQIAIGDGNTALINAEMHYNETEDNTIDSGKCGENVSWTLDKDGLLTISGTGKMRDYDAHNAPWHCKQSEIKSVIVEKNVSNIGVAAFCDCGSLSSVTISEGVATIGEDAFRACSNLTSVTVPEGVTTIGNCAFGDCINLISVSIPESVTTIGNCVFYRCSSLTSVTIPEGITAIDSATFDGCSSLTSLTIPKSVTSIGVYAFEGCSGLTSMTIPESVVTIGVGAFRYCSGLTTVSIPKGVATLDNYTFDGCSSLVSVTIPEGVTTIGDAAFWNCSSLSSVTIPNSVTSIGDYTFRGCSSLSSVTIPESVTSIGDYTFYGCSSLSSVTIPKSVTSIGYATFYGCSSLADVYYSGTEEDWAGITIGSYNASLTNATIHYNCDVPDTSGEVRYFSSWDKENQIAYFETDPQEDPLNFGSQLTAETDTSFLENVNELVGTYVLVKTKGRDDGIIGPDTLLSIKPVETRLGIVKEVSTATKSITIDDTSYDLFDWTQAIVEVDDIVMYHLYEGKIVGTVTAQELSRCGTVTKWNADTRQITIGSDQYSASPFADATTLDTLGDTGEKKLSIAYFMDSGVVYKARPYATEKPPYNTPRDEYEYEEEFKHDPAESYLLDYRDKWDDAYEDFISVVGQALNEYAGRTEVKKRYAIEAEAARMKKHDNESSSKYISGDLERRYEDAAYKALATYFYEEVNNYVVPDLSSVDVSKPMAGVQIVNNIFKNLGGNSKEYVIDGVKFEVVPAIVIMGRAFGEMVINDNQRVVICSTNDECKETITEYVDDLQDLTTSSIYKVVSSIYKDVLGKSLYTLTEDYLNDVAAEIERSFAVELSKELNMAGVGDLFKSLDTCYTYYTWAKKAMDATKTEDIQKAVNNIINLKFEDTSVKNGAVKTAMKQLNNASNKLNRAFNEYLRGTIVQKENGFFRQIFGCPVNVAVYNSAGEQIGYIGEDDLWYADNLIINRIGTSKEIIMLDDEIPSFVVTATDYGEMSCSFEECDNLSSPIGRLNFYNIPLTPGQEFTVTLSDNLEANTESIVLKSNGEVIHANEYISVSESAPVSISCTCDGMDNATIYGAGPYVRGDVAVVCVEPQDGFKFIGWYDGGTLVSDSVAYEFIAREDKSLTARFRQDDSVRVDIISGDGGIAIGDGIYSKGRTVYVLALPLAGHAFSGWYLNGTLLSDDDEYSIDVQSDISLEAMFVNHDHQYLEPTFSWAVDNTCKASFVCTACSTIHVVDCAITQTFIPATETEASKTIYTATAEFNGKTYTDTVTIANSSEVRIDVAGKGLNVSDEVWIDGAKYSVQSDDNGLYVALTDTNARTMVTYSYNNPNATDVHTKYPTGMKVWTLAQENGAYSATYVSELDNLLQYSGSSIRITGNKGIRMITSINQDTRNKLTGNGLAGCKLLEYGTLLAQTSKLGDNPLVLDGGEYVKSNYAYKKGVADPVFKYADGLIQYTNVLVGFTDEQCKEDIAMRPYMKLEDGNGEEFVIYGGIVYRSVGYIAYQNRNAFQPGSAAYEYVWSIIHNVYGNQYDSEYKK